MRRGGEYRQWFKLASRLGKSVAETKTAVSSSEFTEWCLYDQYDPTVGERIDIHAARVMALLATVFSKTKFSPRDFLVDWTGGAGQVDPAIIKRRMMSFARRRQGGTAGNNRRRRNS